MSLQPCHCWLALDVILNRDGYVEVFRQLLVSLGPDIDARIK